GVECLDPLLDGGLQCGGGGGARGAASVRGGHLRQHALETRRQRYIRHVEQRDVRRTLVQRGGLDRVPVRVGELLHIGAGGERGTIGLRQQRTDRRGVQLLREERLIGRHPRRAA